MSEHIQEVIWFHLFFVVPAFLAWLTTPRKKFSRGYICVSDMPIKPNNARKAGTVKANDIMVGGAMCNE